MLAALSALVALTGTIRVDGFAQPVPTPIVRSCEAEVGAPYSWADYTNHQWDHFQDCVADRLYYYTYRRGR
jgi:hypothetical protein